MQVIQEFDVEKLSKAVAKLIELKAVQICAEAIVIEGQDKLMRAVYDPIPESQAAPSGFTSGMWPAQQPQYMQAAVMPVEPERTETAKNALHFLQRMPAFTFNGPYPNDPGVISNDEPSDELVSFAKRVIEARLKRIGSVENE